MRFLGVALIVVLGFCAGCSSERASTGGDAGPVVIDLGEAQDLGAVGSDSGPTNIDLGVDAGGLPPGCNPPAPENPTVLPQCTAATYTCLMPCTTAECQQTCVANDDFSGDGTPDTNCATCTSAFSIRCAYDNGCDDEYNTATCCLAEACAATPTAECAQTNCVAEQNALITCANTALMARPTCANDPINCFPTAG
ncbi:MAG: hypothetical protein IPK60_02305 [Sandaracinaceae bacterium]|nr:hypothetical protein [Sandaracinaceae bacterium]